MTYDPLLLSILCPIIAGVISLCIPERVKIIAKALAFAVTLASLTASAYIFWKKPLAFTYGQHVLLVADTLSAAIAAGIAFFALLVSVYSFGFGARPAGRYFGYVLMTLGGSLGVAYANNLIIMLVFWGFLAAMLYLLVNMQGTARASTAAKKALIIIGGTDALMIFGIGIIWSLSGSLAMNAIRLALDGPLAVAAFLSLAAAAFAKAGAMPFHSWLPEVAEDGPTPVTAYLPASLDKLLGIYLLARCSLTLFAMNTLSNTILCAVGAVTIILAVMLALVQHDLKRLLGFHAVSQVGYMVLGIGTGNAIGIAGGIFHMFNHAVYKACLFLSGGDVEKRMQTTDLDKLGGLAKYMPVTFACFLVASLSISGIPPFNGFVSKWMIYQGVIESATPRNPAWILWLSAAMFGSALTIASFMKLLHAVFLGRPSGDFNGVKEAPFTMVVPVTVLAAVCVVFGVFAFLLPLKYVIAPAVGMTIEYLGSWKPIAATVVIIIGILLGLLSYALLRTAKFRPAATFVGGEDPASLARISGTDFYNTIQEIRPLAAVYKREGEEGFDLYALGRKAMRPFTRIAQELHNGILPTYMVWCLLGMVAMFIFLYIR